MVRRNTARRVIDSSQRDDVGYIPSMITGLILAAGASSRMGSPKALMPVIRDDGVLTLALNCVEDVLDVGGVSLIVTVLGCCSEPIYAVARHGRRTKCDVIVVEHGAWARGRTSSIQAGLAAVPDQSEGVVLAAVDMPYACADTVAALIVAHRANGDEVDAFLPTFGGRRGHPVLLRRSLFDRIARLGGDEPLSNVVGKARVLEVPVSDAGIHIDINTVAELEAANRARRG